MTTTGQPFPVQHRRTWTNECCGPPPSPAPPSTSLLVSEQIVLADLGRPSNDPRVAVKGPLCDFPKTFKEHSSLRKENSFVRALDVFSRRQVEDRFLFSGELRQQLRLGAQNPQKKSSPRRSSTVRMASQAHFY